MYGVSAHLPLVVCASKYHQLEVSNNARVTPSCGNTFAAGGRLQLSGWGGTAAVLRWISLLMRNVLPALWFLNSRFLVM